MADITNGIDGFFWLSLTTLVFTGLALCVRYSYKSKCKTVSCCCLKIERDIETEKEEDMNLDCKSEEKIGL